jgi:hypothetical protein
MSTALAVLNPSLLEALAYIGGATLVASIVGWVMGRIAAARGAGLDPLGVAQHIGYAAGYLALCVVLSLWLGRWVQRL